MNKLFSDMKTDEEKSAFFLSGRGYETGVVALAIQNDVAMAYHRCAEYEKEVQALRKDAERLDFLIAEECQIQSLTLSNGIRHRLYWPESDETQCEWYANPRAAIDSAIDAATEKQK